MGLYGSIYSDVLTKALKALSFLLLVVVLLGSLFYFEDDNEKTHEFLVKLEEEIHYQTNKSVDDNPYDRLKGKIKIDTEFEHPDYGICKGCSYLQPNQISHIQTIGGRKKETMTQGWAKNKLYTKNKLSELESKLNKENKLFFRIKSALINLNYIQDMIKPNKGTNKKTNKKGQIIYQYHGFVVMENKEMIKIHEDKYKELKAIIDKYVG